MNFTWVEWSIVIGVMTFIIYTAIRTNRYIKSVADFMVASRCAGRYLLGISQGEATMGAISIIGGFEYFYQAGWAPGFWGAVAIPLSVFLSLSGFVLYRFRATRAMTMGQFFEMRYSRNFRIFAGFICWISGVINFGIFPQVAARFFINFCAFPPELPIFGMNVPTFPLVMLVLIGLAVFFTFIGGQIAVLVTDFWQGFFAAFIFVAIAGFLWFVFPWSEIKEGLAIASKPGMSLVDPFNIKGQRDFGISYFVINWIFFLYQRGAWQGLQGYQCSAITAHEAKMAPIVGNLRAGMVGLGLMLIPLVAITYMNHPKYAAEAASVVAELQATYPGDEALQRQMRVPVAMSHFVPTILIGCFATAMLGFFISTNNTYLHSWGTILIQDVVCPLRKKPFETKQHLWYLRLSILGVAVFVFFFSLIFPMKDYIYMFFQITGAIYLGGAGAVIIGGLYWKRGTTAAAWSAMIVGSSLALTSIIIQAVWEHIPTLVAWKPKFPVNGQVAAFWCSIAAVLTYVLVSLLGKKSVASMDKILHRGKYAIKEEEDALLERGAQGKPIGWFWKMIGVNSHEFSKIDKALFLYTVCISAYYVVSFGVLLFLHSIGFMNDERWLFYWRIGIFINLTVGSIGMIWVSIGGLFDLRKMYKRLSAARENALDDGRVAGNHNLVDEAESLK